MEFGGSGEDSFVAVVVLKLTGAAAVHPVADDGHHGDSDSQGAWISRPVAARRRPRHRSRSRLPRRSRSPRRSSVVPTSSRSRPRSGHEAAQVNVGGAPSRRARIRLRDRPAPGDAGERNAGPRSADPARERRVRSGKPRSASRGLPVRPSAHHPRLVEARSAATPLASLAGTWFRISLALARPSRQHEHYLGTGAMVAVHTMAAEVETNAGGCRGSEATVHSLPDRRATREP